MLAMLLPNNSYCGGIRKDRCETSPTEQPQEFHDVDDNLSLRRRGLDYNRGANSDIQQQTVGNSQVKMEMPRFNGDNPRAWLYKVDRYFWYYEFLDVQKLIIASIHLDGPAITWFQGVDNNHHLRTWAQFCDLLLQRFDSSPFRDLQGELAKMHQTSNVQSIYFDYFDGSLPADQKKGKGDSGEEDELMRILNLLRAELPSPTSESIFVVHHSSYRTIPFALEVSIDSSVHHNVDDSETFDPPNKTMPLENLKSVHAGDALGKPSLEQSFSFSGGMVSRFLSAAILEPRQPVLCRVLSKKSSSAKSKAAGREKSGTKVFDVSLLIGRASTAGFKIAVAVLDTLGSSMTNLNISSGFSSTLTIKEIKYPS